MQVLIFGTNCKRSGSYIIGRVYIHDSQVLLSKDHSHHDLELLSLGRVADDLWELAPDSSRVPLMFWDLTLSDCDTWTLEIHPSIHNPLDD